MPERESGPGSASRGESVPGREDAAVGGAGAAAEGLSGRARQDLLSRTALGVFRLNGQFLAVSEELARPAGLTAARWQVLGAVLREPLPVAGIARTMGITRQSVQRVADLLAAGGLAEYVPNPAHRRAKLLRPTEAGRAAIARIAPGHATLAARLAAELGESAFAETARVLERLAAALDTLGEPAGGEAGNGEAADEEVPGGDAAPGGAAPGGAAGPS
ncbi:MarR family winged helix-turn-helix transcriptional regulator [Streptomyces sp. CA-243310]|uniref:MarR family winged helix-turn-helix transcriptional regulator n=1 Tax=Streptomyces sp. CA-243310 TaxID=3240056 RepID=UPI003D8C4D57